MMECSNCGSRGTIEQLCAKHPEAISCCPERLMVPIIVFLRDVAADTDDACWVVCAKGDPGAVLFTSGENPALSCRQGTE